MPGKISGEALCKCERSVREPSAGNSIEQRNALTRENEILRERGSLENGEKLLPSLHNVVSGGGRGVLTKEIT